MFVRVEGKNVSNSLTAEKHNMDLTELLKTQMAFESYQDDFETFKPDTFIGTYFQNYKINTVLGQGGMAIVFSAERSDGAYKRKVALKIINPDLSNQDYINRFNMEWSLLADLTHPNIAQMYDAGITEDGVPYMIIEHIDGLNLSDYLKQSQLNFEEKIQLFSKICSAVSYAHENLIIHRDIKPANIIITAKGEPKLLDFGIGCYSTKPTEMNASSTPYTYRFAAPEQIENKRTTFRTDIFQLGYVLYFIVSSNHLLANKNKEEIERHLTNNQTPIFDRNSFRRKRIKHGIPRAILNELTEVTAKTLERKTSDRYATVEYLNQDVLALLASRPISIFSESSSYIMKKFVSRNYLTTLIFFLFSILLISITALYIYNLNIAKKIAETESKKSNQSLSLIEEVFTLTNPYSSDSDTTNLNQAIEKLESTLTEDVYTLGTVVRMRFTLAKIQYAIKRYGDARENLEYLRTINENSGVSLLHLYSLTLFKLSAFDEAEKIVDQILSESTKLKPKQKDIVELLSLKSAIFLKTRNVKKSIDIAKKATFIARKLDKESLLTALDALTAALSTSFDSPKEVLKLLNEQEGNVILLYGSKHIGLGSIYLRRATARRILEDWSGAKSDLLKAMSIWEHYPLIISQERAETLSTLGNYYNRNGNTKRALELYKESASILFRIHDGDYIMYLPLIAQELNSLWQAGRNEEAYKKGKTVLSDIKNINNLGTAEYFVDLAKIEEIMGVFELELGNITMAKKYYNSVLSAYKNYYPIDSSKTNLILLRIAHLKCIDRNVDHGLSINDTLGTYFKKKYDEKSSNLSDYYYTLGICLKMEGKLNQAKEALNHTIKIRENIGNNSLYFYTSYSYLEHAEISIIENNLEDAKQHFLKAKEHYDNYRMFFAEHAIEHNDLAIKMLTTEYQLAEYSKDEERLKELKHRLILVEDKVNMDMPRIKKYIR